MNFDGRDVTYDISELDELVLAYATTIHKAQGSEYPIVVMPVTMSHFSDASEKSALYCVTRAKKILDYDRREESGRLCHKKRDHDGPEYEAGGAAGRNASGEKHNYGFL